MIKDKLALLAILFCGMTSGFAQANVSYPEVLRQLHQNVLRHILSNAVTDEEVKTWLESLDAKGSWPDIDYASQERGGWPPANHLGRLQNLAKGYRTPSSAYFHAPELSQAVHRALNYWLDSDLICPNWWYPQIGVPMQLSPTLFLIEEELSPEQVEKSLKILDRSKIGMTGQNKVWLSGNVLMKSLLLRDETTIRQAAVSIQEELRAGQGEGIQPDWSFHQHGPQLQFGNYGLSYAESMIQWISLLRETPFQFDENKLSIVRNYLLEGLQWVTWKDRLDISACGRQLFPDAPKQKARSVARSLQNMGTLDTPFSAAYRQAAQYANLTGNRHFWRSDFLVHRTPDFYFSVKMCSKRVVGAESCNSENMQGYHMGDGAAFLYRTGVEYENIFPFWDWKKIPGITAPQNDRPLPVLTCRGYRLESDFVGGLSDGVTGIAVLDYTRDGLKARKSWFLFQNMIVCLGAGITSTGGDPVTTSINQMLLDGQTVVKKGQRQTMENGSWDFQDPKWVWHGYTGYYFPQGGKIQLENKAVSGSWHTVATRYPDKKMEALVFRLWLDHGRNPSGQTYAYYMVPNADIKDMEKLEAKQPYRILHNTEAIQGVVSSDGATAAITFYQAGKVGVLGGVEVDQPCLLLLQREKKGDLRLSVADPTQKLENIQIVLGGRYEAVEGNGRVNVDGERSILTLLLPKSEEAGKTVSVTLRLN